MTSCTYTSQFSEMARHTNGLRSILPATARVAVDIEIRVDRIGGRDEGAMGFVVRFVIGLLLALEGLESL